VSEDLALFKVLTPEQEERRRATLINKRGHCSHDNPITERCFACEAEVAAAVARVKGESHVCHPRCIGARGEKCTCPCHGKNHGRAIQLNIFKDLLEGDEEHD
jgi:hypothetical protein